jgi:hypothetical protein
MPKKETEVARIVSLPQPSALVGIKYTRGTSGVVRTDWTVYRETVSHNTSSVATWNDESIHSVRLLLLHYPRGSTPGVHPWSCPSSFDIQMFNPDSGIRGSVLTIPHLERYRCSKTDN